MVFQNLCQMLLCSGETGSERTLASAGHLRYLFVVQTLQQYEIQYQPLLSWQFFQSFPEFYRRDAAFGDLIGSLIGSPAFGLGGVFVKEKFLAAALPQSIDRLSDAGAGKPGPCLPLIPGPYPGSDELENGVLHNLFGQSAVAGYPEARAVKPLRVGFVEIYGLFSCHSVFDFLQYKRILPGIVTDY